MKVGGAAVAKEHANFLTNTGEASATDIRALAGQLKDAVQERFGIPLQEEVEYVGVWPDHETNLTTDA